MSRSIKPRTAARPVSYLTGYDKKVDPAPTEDITIPGDLSATSDADLAALAERVSAAFSDLYGDGSGSFSDDDLATLGTLRDGIVKLQAEIDARTLAATERSEKAAALAAEVMPGDEDDDEDEQDPDDPNSTVGEAEERAEKADPDDPTPEDPVTGKPVPGADADDEDDDEDDPNAVTAAGAKRGNLVIKGLGRNRAAAARSREVARSHSGVAPGLRMYAAPDLPGFAAGAELTVEQIAQGVDTRMRGFNPKTFEMAAKTGRVVRQTYSVASLRRTFDPSLVASADDSKERVLQIMDLAADESRLQGGSLLASGGWSAPSETLYDLFTPLESMDGLASIPEIGVTRGGINFTPGPDYSDIYAETGFTFTESQDISGADYPKPTYHVGDPEFTNVRLALAGVAITAGLLQKRGYPEMIARVIAGSLVAHAHRVNASVINSMVSQSTAVSLAAGQIGSTAPILSAIELQTEHYKATHRMSRGATLEAMFPFWVRGAIRSDLSRRLGVPINEAMSITDAQINSWFTQRGIAPQFVYDWQDVASTPASGFNQWPTSVEFLLYAAGTFVRGSSDVVTLDTIYDSTLLGTNDYTALFTEEGYLVAKRGVDARVVTVPIASTGQTAAGVTIANDGASS